jgi:hypothetical protein
MSYVEKRFFFEKKNQKTLTISPLPKARGGRTGARRKGQKFFGSFFQKRTAFLTHAPAPLA